MRDLEREGAKLWSGTLLLVFGYRITIRKKMNKVKEWTEK